MKNLKNGKPVILLFIAAALFSLFSCSFFKSFDDDDEENSIEITSLTMGKSSVSMKVGAMDYVAVNIKPQDQQKNVKLNWTYDSSIIECDTSSNWGITIKGLSEGQTSLKCSYNGYDATCLITVAGYEENYEKTTEPYIYSNTTTIQTTPGVTEKVFVSLYGGNAGDIDGYTWTIDNSSVASIQPTGQYCFITAKDSGYARIKVTHQKSAYPYYMGVYVFADTSNVTYITTDDNILTMNKDDDEKIISVSLVNGKDTSLDSNFSWEIINQDSEGAPVSLQYNENKAVLEPLESGSCTVRVTHPDAVYPLDILCRVITVVKNVYIQPDRTVVYINGDEQKIISCSLENAAGLDYTVDEYDYKLDDYNVAEIVNYAGNQAVIQGKANGSCKLIISHPKSKYSREVLLIVTGQNINAADITVDASCYITTNQDYIRTKLGAEPTEILISLKGGESGDESLFVWNVQNNALLDNKNVISLETVNGTVIHSRSAAQSYIYGRAYITPNAEGIAVISVTHPKILYPTEILVKVLPEEAILEEPLYFAGSGLIKMLNGENYEYTVELKGKNKNFDDNEKIKWEAEDDRISIYAAGNTANISSSSGIGSTVSHIKISHPKCDAEKKVLVMTADDLETLNSMKALYSDKLYFNIEAGDTAVCMAMAAGFQGNYDEETGEYIPYDFRMAKWIVKNPEIAEVEKSEEMPLTAIVKGLKPGSTTVTVSLEDASCDFTITLYPVGTVAIEPEVYLTTNQNVVFLDRTGKQLSINVTPVNLSSKEYMNITWHCDDEKVASVISNGRSAEITARSEGETVIYVTHPESQNVLKIYVRVGSEFTGTDTLEAQICSADIIKVSVNDEPKKLTALINNSASSGFLFSCSDESVAKIVSQSKDGICLVQGISKGFCEIEIKNSAVKSSKYVLVVVGNTEDEVEEMLKSSIYFTTANNVLSFKKHDENARLTLKAFNLPDEKINEIEWTSDNPEIALVAGNGISAWVKAVSNGQCKIRASHKDSINQLIFYVFVNAEEDTGTAVSSLCISAPEVFKIKTGEEKILQASLLNYSGLDTDGFFFKIDNTFVAEIDCQSESGNANIAGKNKGAAIITVSHKITGITKSVLVICAETDEEIENILNEKVYLSSSWNVVSFSKTGELKNITIKAENLPKYDYSKIRWNSSDESVVKVAENGTSASLYSLSKGKAVIQVSCEGSLNSLTFFVFVDTQEITEIPVSAVYISAPDIITLKTGGNSVKVTARLENYSKIQDGFSFISENPSIAEITVQNSEGSAVVKPVSSGTTLIHVKNERTDVEKSVIVIVGRTDEEIAEKLQNSVYLTSSSNVIVFSDIKTSSFSQAVIKAVNLPEESYSQIEWKCTDETVCEIIPNGISASIRPLSFGSTEISVCHPDSINSVKFYVYVYNQENEKDNDAEILKTIYIDSADSMTFLKDGAVQSLNAVLVNYTGSDSTGFSFTIDNESIAEIAAQSSTGIAYIKPVSSGQAEITVRHTATPVTKKVLVLVGNSEEELSGITYLTTNQDVVAVGEGNTRNISVSIKNSDEIILDGYTWTSSNPATADITYTGATAVLKGNSIGTTIITVSNKICKYPLQIIVQVVDPIAAAATPFIQLTSSVMTLTCGNTYSSITAELVGGTDSDKSDFIWSSNDSKIAAVYGQNEVGKIKALTAGTTYINVSHPKAAYPAQLLVVCDEVKETDCSISVPSSIVAMKPTDSTQTITATLINGSTNDKYNFSWSLDVYDIIDFQYSANVCTITPKQTGSVTITISHPKAAYPQQIVVNVQEYADFSFPYTNTTITQGNVCFLNMQVPAAKVAVHVEYSVDNPNICSISGTKAVAQIQAIQNGTTTVRAKMIASSTGVVQAESEMLVYVKEKPADSVFITAGTTVYTVQKGKSQTLSATLTGTGITSSDSSNLTWTTSDSDIVQVTGISSNGTVKGSQIYITALKSGEALISCSHEKAASTLQFYVVVPGNAEKVVTLNKNYITLTKGSSGTTLKADIENAETSSDYYNLIWTCEDISGNGKTVAKVMGNINSNGEVTGQTVTVYPVSSGEARITAQLPDTSKTASCTVLVQEAKSFTFEQTTKKVQPFNSCTVKYTVSPADAALTWTTTQDDSYFEYSDLGTDSQGIGYLQITGIKEGSGSIYCVTDGGAKGSLTVKVSWDYSFTLDSQQISGTPDKTYTVAYNVNPSDANIIVTDSEDLFQTTIKKDTTDSGSGKITLVPKSTGKTVLTIKAVNPKEENSEKAVVGIHTVSASLCYSELTVTPVIVSDVSTSENENAWYSSIYGDVIYLGDGESITVQLKCAEEKVSPTYRITPSLINGISFSTNKNGEFTLSSSEDKTEDCYQITEGYAPTYNGSRTYASGIDIKPDDFKYSCQAYYHGETFLKSKISGDFFIYNEKNGNTIYLWNFGPFELGNNEDKYVSISVKDGKTDIGNWGKIREPSLDGVCMSVEDFTGCLWYYWPQFVDYKIQCTTDNWIRVNHNEAEIDTNHIKAKYCKPEENPDTTIKSTTSAGTLRISISNVNNSSIKDITIPIVLETRNCKCTYKE